MQRVTALFSLLLGLTSMANADQSKPPLQYQLSQVSISVLHHTSRNIPGGYQITIAGDGSGTYTRTEAGNKIESSLQSTKEDLLELLNEFYRIHFFELADNYTVKKRVLLKDGSTVATIGERVVDISSKRLCITLADFKKCVTIVADQPAEAAQLVQKIEGMFGN